MIRLIYENGILKHDKHYECLLSFSELEDLKNKLDSTLEYYTKENVNDDILKSLNNYSKKQSIINSNEVLFNEKIKNDRKRGLYLISEENKFFKIGIAEDVEKRLKQLKTSNHNHLKPLYFIKGMGKIESLIHTHFYKLNKNGEWFFYSELILELFEKLNSNQHLFEGLHSKIDLDYAFKKLIKL